jgi:DNA-binding transcriptional ArsR family regulator
MAGPNSGAREILVGRLRSRRIEVGESILARVRGLNGPKEDGIGTGRGLAATVAATVDYGFETIESGEEKVPPIPAAVLVEVTRAARAGLSVDTLLRRYVAGHALLAEFVIEEATQAGLRGESLKQVLRDLATVFNRLLEAVSQEFLRPTAEPPSSKAMRLARVRRLLAGEPVDPSAIAYEFEAVHVGVIAEGTRPAESVQEIKNSVDCRLLVVTPTDTRAWVWVAHRRLIDAGEVKQALDMCAPELVVAVGEPLQGLTGWRLTHEQAKAALPIARHRKATVRYVEVALLASLVRDDLLSASLRQLYLVPLESTADGGLKLRRTLRAYIEAQRNVSSAAAALGVSRRTVSNHLRVAERMIGRPLDPELPALEAALALEALRIEDSSS